MSFYVCILDVVIRYANCTFSASYYVVICSLYHIFPLYLIHGMILGKNTLDIQCVF